MSACVPQRDDSCSATSPSFNACHGLCLRERAHVQHSRRIFVTMRGSPRIAAIMSGVGRSTCVAGFLCDDDENQCAMHVYENQ